MRIDREEKLIGKTYKLKTGKFSYFITINDYEDKNGRFTPYEMFINTKDINNFSYLIALTRLISGIFQTNPNNYRFISKELMQIHDPTYGVWRKGRYYPSLLAEIGEILEIHFDELDKINEKNS